MCRDLLGSSEFCDSKAAAGGCSGGAGRVVRPSRGWTAFTAYGLQMRSAVRASHPGATAVQIEKVRSPRFTDSMTGVPGSRNATLTTPTLVELALHAGLRLKSVPFVSSVSYPQQLTIFTQITSARFEKWML